MIVCNNSDSSDAPFFVNYMPIDILQQNYLYPPWLFRAEKEATARMCNLVVSG